MPCGPVDPMRVIATAGHVDHGKSTLVRALTGIEPDRWAAERARGLTIDLGYAWTTLPSGEEIAFVDVPGHERFIGNMLAGIGPVPAVIFVIAADEGWRPQSTEHLAALSALDIGHGLVVVTRSDLADPRPAIREAMDRLDGSPLAGCQAIAVSGVTGQGLDELRVRLDELTRTLPEPDPSARARMWVDRVFTIRGSGTVVTGTLPQGRLRVGDRVRLGEMEAVIRGLESLERAREEVTAVARVAVNVRGITADQVGRGDALLTPDAWPFTDAVDVRLTSAADRLPEYLMVHVGTAALQARVRRLDEQAVRLSLPRPLPLQAGDRFILRDPGVRQVVGGALVLDVSPPALTRRGAARSRGESLRGARGEVDPVAEIAVRGAMRTGELRILGADPDRLADPDVHRHGDWLICDASWRAWGDRLRARVEAYAAAHPLHPRMSMAAAASAAELPELGLVTPLAKAFGLEVREGFVSPAGVVSDLGTAEAGVAQLERRLSSNPFAAPERRELAALGLGPGEIAAAVRLGRLLDLGELVVLAPLGPAQAMRILAGLPQPFTTSQARQALGTTRRVVIPLLEMLDKRGWTRRIDAGHREVVRRR